MIGISYFAWLGTIYLFILTWMDLKNNMRIDDRFNHFMLGISISLYSHYNHGILYGISILGIVLLLRLLLSKMKFVGDGDSNTLMWIFLGLSIINPIHTFFFYILFITITILYRLLIKILKLSMPQPYYPVILLSFILNCLWVGIYV